LLALVKLTSREIAIFTDVLQDYLEISKFLYIKKELSLGGHYSLRRFKKKEALYAEVCTGATPKLASALTPPKEKRTYAAAEANRWRYQVVPLPEQQRSSCVNHGFGADQLHIVPTDISGWIGRWDSGTDFESVPAFILLTAAYSDG